MLDELLGAQCTFSAPPGLPGAWRWAGLEQVSHSSCCTGLAGAGSQAGPHPCSFQITRFRWSPRIHISNQVWCGYPSLGTVALDNRVGNIWCLFLCPALPLGQGCLRSGTHPLHLSLDPGSKDTFPCGHTELCVLGHLSSLFVFCLGF